MYQVAPVNKLISQDVIIRTINPPMQAPSYWRAFFYLKKSVLNRFFLNNDHFVMIGIFQDYKVP
jgi:hypothetical protein